MNRIGMTYHSELVIGSHRFSEWERAKSLSATLLLSRSSEFWLPLYAFVGIVKLWSLNVRISQPTYTSWMGYAICSQT